MPAYPYEQGESGWADLAKAEATGGPFHILSDRVAQLGLAIDELHARLGPVLHPGVPHAVEQDKAQERGSDLAELSRRVAAETDKLARLMQRIDL